MIGWCSKDLLKLESKKSSIKERRMKTVMKKVGVNEKWYSDVLLITETA